MSEVLGKISFSDVPDVNNVLVLLNAGNTPSIMSDVLANRPAFGTLGRLFIDTTNNKLQRDTGFAWEDLGGGGSPGSPVTSVQYNQGGTFAGNSYFTWSTTSNSLRINNGTPNLQLNLGGITDPGTASFYTEVNSGGTDIEAFRVYFNRGSTATSAWITNAYDGAAPYQRYIDGDDDPAYIRFDSIGTGSFGTPQYRNQFGARGDAGNVTDGFSWKFNGNEIASMGSQFFLRPSGTTAQRPTGVNGMVRQNTTEGLPEVYLNGAWGTQGGVIDKSVVTTSTTTNGNTTFISYNLPGGTLGTNRLIRIKAAGTWQNSSGSNRQVTLYFSYGGVTLWSDNSANHNGGGNGIVGWTAEMYFTSNSSTGAQTVNGIIMIGGTGTSGGGSTTGDLGSDEIISNTVLTGSSAVNSNNNQDLEMSRSFNGSGNTWSTYFYIIEVI